MDQYYSSLINKPPPPNFVYSFEVPFLCNICLLIYIIYRLKTREWNFNKARTRIFCMIALGLAARCSYEGELIYYYYATGNVYIPYHFEGEIFYILDNLPLLLLITIECIFVRSWYQLYLGLSNPETAFEKYQKFRFILPVSNILVYLAFIILLIALHLWQYVFYLVASQAMLCMSFLTLTGLVVFTGVKLEKQAIELADLTQVISWNSSRFKYIRVVLVICCFNKLFQLGGDLIAEVNGYARLNGLMQEDQDASEFAKELVFVLYTVFGYVGESGSFLCLISLLDVFQKNTKASLCSNIFAIQ